MTPLRSNINKDTCSPVSSNCVIWQGEDLCCIQLCTGDTISEVTYKLATEICTLKDELNLTDLDLKCLVDACVQCPEPEKTLKIVLQLLIDKVCALEEIVAALDPGAGGNDPLIRMASCLQYTDPATGDIIRDLPLSEYVKRIGTRVCDIASQILSIQGIISSIQNDIIDLDVRVDALEAATDPQVTLTCVNPGVQDMDEAIEAIEQDYCTIKGALGTAGELLDVIDNECELPVKKLTDPDMDLWTGTSVTIAETLEKMWLAICDLRGAVKTIQDNCCKITCDDIIIDFDVKIVDSNTLLLFFGVKTSVPNGFTDCNGTLGNKLTITDGSGNTWTTYIKIREDVLDDVDVLANGYEIDITNSPLDTSAGLNLSMDACMTNGDTTCVKCVDVSVAAKPCDFCTIITEGAEGASVVIVYETNGNGLITNPIPATTSTTTAAPTTTTTTIAP